MPKISQDEFQEISKNSLAQTLKLMGKELGEAGKTVKTQERKLYFAGYYLTILEYIHAIKDCINTNNLIAVTPIFRSCLEAFLYLINLEKYDEYYLLLYAGHLKEQISKINSLSQDKNNPYSYFLDGIENIDKKLNTLDKEKRQALDKTKKLRQNFNNPYSVSSKFKLAEAENEYGGIYGIISDECHNNLISIERRHFNLDSGIFNLEIFSEDNYQKLIPHIHTTIGIAQTSTKLRYEFLMGEGFKLNSDFEELKEKFLDKVQERETT